MSSILPMKMSLFFIQILFSMKFRQIFSIAVCCSCTTFIIKSPIFTIYLSGQLKNDFPNSPLQIQHILEKKYVNMGKVW